MNNKQYLIAAVITWLASMGASYNYAVSSGVDPLRAGVTILGVTVLLVVLELLGVPERLFTRGMRRGRRRYGRRRDDI